MNVFQKIYVLGQFFICSIYPPWIETELEILKAKEQILEQERKNGDQDQKTQAEAIATLEEQVRNRF